MLFCRHQSAHPRAGGGREGLPLHHEGGHGRGYPQRAVPGVRGAQRPPLRHQDRQHPVHHPGGEDVRPRLLGNG